MPAESAIYRFPPDLGGGEYAEHRRPDGTTDAPIGTVAFLIGGRRVYVAEGMLTEVRRPWAVARPGSGARVDLIPDGRP